MKYNEIVKLFNRSEFRTAITKNLPKEVVETVFNRSLQQGVNPFLPLFQIGLETGGLPKLHIKNNNSYNWFNITAVGNQKYVIYPVPEYDKNGKMFMKNVKFRIFDSLNDAVDEFLNLIKRSYPNYNNVDYKSLTHRNGAAYASGDYNGKSYTVKIIDAARKNFNMIGIKDYSIENLIKIFKHDVPDIPKEDGGRSVKAELFSKRETVANTAIFKGIKVGVDKILNNKKNSNQTGKKIESNKNNIKTVKTVKSVNGIVDNKIIGRKDKKETINPNRKESFFEITINGKSLKLSNLDSKATDKWNDFIRKATSEFVSNNKMTVDYDRMIFEVDDGIKFNKLMDKLTKDYIDFRKSK